MRKLTDIPDDEVFYRGTIIIIKGAEITPKGAYDKMYCMIGNIGANFGMLDLYRSMGSCVLHDLTPNVKGHVGVNKEGIKAWVTEYFNLFYTQEGKDLWVPKIDDIVYVDNLSSFFTQANRDLFMK